MSNTPAQTPPQPTASYYQQEWGALHATYEQSEVLSLAIKIVATLCCALWIGMGLPPIIGSVILSVFWLQDAIWKTFQSRTETRLIQLEHSLNNAPLTQGFYSHWEHSRPGTLGLIKSYIRTAIRPTVAYPYAALIGLMLVCSVTPPA